MTTRVVNRKVDPFDVYIGRGSFWGNPVKLKSRDPLDVVDCLLGYVAHLEADMNIALHAATLQGYTLGCYCKPGRCHGDILARIADCDENTYALVAKIRAELEAERAQLMSQASAVTSTAFFTTTHRRLKTLHYARAEGRQVIAYTEGGASRYTLDRTIAAEIFTTPTPLLDQELAHNAERAWLESNTWFKQSKEDP